MALLKEIERKYSLVLLNLSKRLSFHDISVNFLKQEYDIIENSVDIHFIAIVSDIFSDVSKLVRDSSIFKNRKKYEFISYICFAMHFKNSEMDNIQ